MGEIGQTIRPSTNNLPFDKLLGPVILNHILNLFKVEDEKLGETSSKHNNHISLVTLCAEKRIRIFEYA